ncbi:unnamed protein product [Vitrella brassicaformis CCMP3155]|uniref:HTH OST-type domain-containing protein n=2 Tax=Vitrella brassicaformis TaxID=1169539 RepID=A0A0G4G2V6_VITBC|nr:unnamed protein product [Vitrella brassicaformis CCMP3155]|eukprot:CEM22527.1 unnamed protein product [Vitrella brassicaformis CCMP3155]
MAPSLSVRVYASNNQPPCPPSQPPPPPPHPSEICPDGRPHECGILPEPSPPLVRAYSESHHHVHRPRTMTMCSPDTLRPSYHDATTQRQLVPPAPPAPPLVRHLSYGGVYPQPPPPPVSPRKSRGRFSSPNGSANRGGSTHSGASGSTSSRESGSPSVVVPVFQLRNDDLSTLHEAIVSLYRDRIVPVYFNLKGRLHELSASAFVKAQFMTVYRMFPDIYVVLTPAGQDEEAVLLKETPVWFRGWVDPNSEEDEYAEAMWTEFAQWLRERLTSGDSVAYSFVGGRYGMAQSLRKMELPFFKGMSLGEYCHLVQLAISRRRLLAYEDNVLKPVASCSNVCYANLGIPDQKRAGKDCITDLEELKRYLATLLVLYPNGFNLSTLKRKIKAKFNRELCQTVFHCTKLIDLISSPPLTDVCTVDRSSRHMRILPVQQTSCCQAA